MLSLVLAFLKIGLASFGGGWTIVGIINAEIVGKAWLTAGEFERLLAVAQITPGPVALNAATLVGYRLHGLPGALAATIAVIAAPVAIGLAVGSLYSRASRSNDRLPEALKTGTIALILMTVWSFAPRAVSSPLNAALALAAFSVASFTKVNPLWAILGSGAIGAAARALFT